MNKSLRVLVLFNGIFVFASSLLGPLYAIYVDGIANSVLAVSSSWAVFLFSTTVFTYLMARWGDRLKAKENFLILGYFVRAVVWFGYIYVGSLQALLLLQFLLGLGEAFGTPAYDAIFAEHLEKNKHIKDYSIWKVVSTLLGALATCMGGLLVTGYGFVPLFAIMSVLALVSMFGIILSPSNLLQTQLATKT